MSAIDEIIEQLGLEAHPEGGYYKETYRSKGTITTGNPGWEFSGGRNFSTAIYFLLTSASYSAFHRIKQDEIWHFYRGSPIKLHLIDVEGNYNTVLIGADLKQGQSLQFVVPANWWFAAEVTIADSYALVGCTVAPGFDFADFELASKKALTELYPLHKGIIARLTRT